MATVTATVFLSRGNKTQSLKGENDEKECRTTKKGTGRPQDSRIGKAFLPTTEDCRYRVRAAPSIRSVGVRPQAEASHGYNRGY